MPKIKKQKLSANNGNKLDGITRRVRILFSYLGSFERWQITSTAKLKARPKAIASHNEVLVINALIIMTKENMANITVKAFFSVKYFFIIVDLRETSRWANIESLSLFSSHASAETWIPSTKILL